jgi:F1F0 ATPase subunit 2
MADPVQLLLAIAAGLALGLVHFGGLWWTVQRLPTATRPVLLMLLSAAARVALVLPALVWFAVESVPSLACALIGLLMARTLLLWH